MEAIDSQASGADHSLETDVSAKRLWTYIECSEFQVARPRYLSDVEFEAIKAVIPRHPECWVELRGGPGLFGLHWGVRAPITIVFAVAPDPRKVYLLAIEAGKHDSVNEEVRRSLAKWVKNLKAIGVRVAMWYGIKQLVKWILDNWPWH